MTAPFPGDEPFEKVLAWRAVPHMREMDAYNFCDSNSLLPLTNSLLFEIFSLLICIGNCAKSRCGTAVSCSNIVSGSPGIAKFPVKFPVSREFAWRRVRLALRRQPSSPRLGEMPPIVAERPANSGLLQFGVPSLCSRLLRMTTEFRESLWLTPRIFPFLGDAGRRPGSIMHCVVNAAVRSSVPMHAIWQKADALKVRRFW
jgi:hypothetical protein